MRPAPIVCSEESPLVRQQAQAFCQMCIRDSYHTVTVELAMLDETHS